MKRHKMSKKGFEISSLLGWIIGILAVFIILFIVLGPNQLLAMARDAAFSFGIGVPGEKPPEISAGKDKIPEELARYFDYLIDYLTNIINEEIKKSDNERCLIPLDVTLGPKENYFITFSPGYVSIKKKIRESSYALTDKSQSIPGFKPCVVANQGGVNFFYNWLDGSIEKTNPSKPEYFNDSKANSLIIFESKTRLITPNDNGIYELKDAEPKEYYLLLYKADANHVCFMPSWDDGGPWPFINNDCNVPTGGDIQKGLDSDCFEAIVENIPICGHAKQWKEILQNYEKNKCKVDKSTCEATNLPCQCFTLGGYDTKKEPETCTKREPYCYEKGYGCDNAIDPDLCKKALGSDYVPPPKCEVDKSTCEVTNAPCSCNTARSKFDSSLLPETCTKNQYCYDGEYGCDNAIDPDLCKKVLGSDYVPPPKCEVDKSTYEVTNAPCSCDTAWSKSNPGTTLPETCTKNQYCYDGKSGCDSMR